MSTPFSAVQGYRLGSTTHPPDSTCPREFVGPTGESGFNRFLQHVLFDFSALSFIYCVIKR
jgi:hypothetical protein